MCTVRRERSWPSTLKVRTHKHYFTDLCIACDLCLAAYLSAISITNTADLLNILSDQYMFLNMVRLQLYTLISRAVIWWSYGSASSVLMMKPRSNVLIINKGTLVVCPCPCLFMKPTNMGWRMSLQDLLYWICWKEILISRKNAQSFL